MFLFVASALAATPPFGLQIGWPCQRLNWGWRNVWSTCSINSFAPITGASEVSAGAGFRFAGTTGPAVPFVTAATAPTMALASTGIYTPFTAGVTTTSAAQPLYLCTNSAATGSGVTANVRNRCRRAIDAYSALVKTCGLPPLTAGNRGPLQGPLSTVVTPDYAPAAGHLPHTTNSANLITNALLCTLPLGTAGAAPNIGTPATTCPGLLGWFTVVYNACGFTNAPGLKSTPDLSPQNPSNFPNYIPQGATTVTTASAVYAPATGQMGLFCGSPVTSAGANIPPQGAPYAWNIKGTNSGPVNPAIVTFPTSRCRKAMDQFGRTATRCHASLGQAAGPAQAGGYNDPLRILAIGQSAGQGAGTAPAAPAGWNVWVPNCNTPNL